MLSKDDLWECLADYPEARSVLLEKGRQMLRKDNLLDEDVARMQDLEQESTEQKVGRLEIGLDTICTRFARLLGDFNSMQLKLKQRVSKLEKHVLPEPEEFLLEAEGAEEGKETKNGLEGGKSSARKRNDSVDSADGSGSSSQRKSLTRSLRKMNSTESNTSDVVAGGQSPIAEEVFEKDATPSEPEVATTESKKDVDEKLSEKDQTRSDKDDTNIAEQPAEETKEEQT